MKQTTTKPATKPATKKTPKPKIAITMIGEDRFIVTINGQHARQSQPASCLCFKADGFIVKIGRRHNEAAFYRSIHSKDRRYFVPIIESGKVASYHYVVQPLLRFRRGRRSNQAWCIVYALEERYGLWDVSAPDNWAILPNGQPIIYDYEL